MCSRGQVPVHTSGRDSFATAPVCQELGLMEYFQFSFDNLLPRQENGGMVRGEWHYYSLFLSPSYLEILQKTALTSLRGANNKRKRNLSPKHPNSRTIHAHFLCAVKIFLFHHFNTHLISAIKQDPKRQVLRHTQHTSTLWLTSCTPSRSLDHDIQLVPAHHSTKAGNIEGQL